MPEKQGMMVEIGRPQQVIAVCLILIYIVVVGYLLIIFARTKSSKNKNHSNYEQIQEYSDETSNNNNENDGDDDMQVNSSLINRRIENGILKSEKTIDETDVLVIKDSSEHFQIMNHVSLIVILTFNSFLVNF
jgi:hypothetical protein